MTDRKRIWNSGVGNWCPRKSLYQMVFSNGCGFRYWCPLDYVQATRYSGSSCKHLLLNITFFEKKKNHLEKNSYLLRINFCVPHLCCCVLFFRYIFQLCFGCFVGLGCCLYYWYILILMCVHWPIWPFSVVVFLLSQQFCKFVHLFTSGLFFTSG